MAPLSSFPSEAVLGRDSYEKSPFSSSIEIVFMSSELDMLPIRTMPVARSDNKPCDIDLSTIPTPGSCLLTTLPTEVLENILHRCLPHTVREKNTHRDHGFSLKDHNVRLSIGLSANILRTCRLMYIIWQPILARNCTIRMVPGGYQWDLSREDQAALSVQREDKLKWLRKCQRIGIFCDVKYLVTSTRIRTRWNGVNRGILDKLKHLPFEQTRDVRLRRDTQAFGMAISYLDKLHRLLKSQDLMRLEVRLLLETETTRAQHLIRDGCLDHLKKWGNVEHGKLTLSPESFSVEERLASQACPPIFRVVED